MNRINLPKPPASDRWIRAPHLAIFLIFTPLSIWNLVHIQNLLPSLLWLTFAGFTAWNTSKNEGGWISFLTSEWRHITGHEFIEISDAKVVVGHTAFTRSIIQNAIPLHEVVSVEWSLGQATSIAGRDMNDWQLTLWHRGGHLKINPLFRPGETSVSIGPIETKTEIEVLGQAIVDALKTAGLTLHSIKEQTAFAVSLPV